MNIKQYKKNGRNYYWFQTRIGKKVITRRGFLTKTDAISEYIKVTKEHELRENGEIKYQEVYEMFLKLYKTKVKESTFFSNTRIFEIHILPIFGDIFVKDITASDCQQFAMDMMEYVKGRMFFNQASRVMKYALNLGYITENPFDKVLHPKYKESKVCYNFLEANEVNMLLDYFQDNLYWYCAFRLLIYTGIRRGELLALNWQDIDFNNKELSINKTLTIGMKSKLIVTTPKSKKSIRTIKLDNLTLHNLKKLKIQSSSDIIFPNKKGNYNRLSNVSDRLKVALKNIGLRDIRVHDLRHTHASLLFASGSSMKEVQERLGHSDIKTTMNIYTHVTKDDRNESLEKFVNYLENTN